MIPNCSLTLVAAGKRTGLPKDLHWNVEGEPSTFSEVVEYVYEYADRYLEGRASFYTISEVLRPALCRYCKIYDINRVTGLVSLMSPRFNCSFSSHAR